MDRLTSRCRTRNPQMIGYGVYAANRNPDAVGLVVTRLDPAPTVARTARVVRTLVARGFLQHLEKFGLVGVGDPCRCLDHWLRRAELLDAETIARWQRGDRAAQRRRERLGLPAPRTVCPHGTELERGDS